jgi:hypothetical protein
MYPNYGKDFRVVLAAVSTQIAYPNYGKDFRVVLAAVSTQIAYPNYGKDFRVVLAAVSTQIALKLPQLWEGLSGRLSCGFDINSIIKARERVEEATRLLQKYLAPSSV